MTAPRPGMVWYRDDLRVSDHPALQAASNTHAPAVCIYVLDEKAPGVRPLGGAARWWLAQSLRALQTSLQLERGASLVLRKGPAARIIAELARETDAEAVSGMRWRNRRIRPSPIRCRGAHGKSVSRRSPFPAISWSRPPDPHQGKRGLRVFTPFWRRVQALGRSAYTAAAAEEP